MSDSAERISCLMVTRPSPERFDLLRRSVACFLAQTYRDRELVVVLDEGPPQDVARLKDYLAGVPGVSRVLQPPTKCSLGALRNLSIEAACGAVACFWDDDDLSHPQRLAEQHRFLQREGALASGLQEVLLFFAGSRELYLCNFQNTPDRCVGGTLMFHRSARARCPEEGPDSIRDEDTALLLALQREGKLVHLGGAAHLYVYVQHGSNTCTAEHHRLLANSLGISRALVMRRRTVFENLGCFDLGEGPIDVVGTNGPAFRIPGRQLALGAAPR